MKAKVLGFLIWGILCCFLMSAAVEAQTGEEALFMTSTAPDALVVMDLSGSMAWNPPGDDLPYGSTETCYADAANCNGTGCSGGFCSSSKSAVTYYARAACGTADTTNCVGANCANGFCSSSRSSSTFYAASSCTTADTNRCSGTGCGRTDGFCNSPVSGATYYAHSSCSTPDTSECRYSETWNDCANGFCASSHSSSRRSCTVQCSKAPCNTTCTTASCSVQCTSGGCTKNCSRLAIAKRSIFNILDDNNDNVINSTDETSLGVRLGYMRFYNCSDDDTGGSYTSGCNTLVKAINSSYSSINTSVQAESTGGGTPIASALTEAKMYLDVHKAADAAKDCRQKFVILITDGSDTYACDSDGSECDNDRYKNRREVVAKAKALADAGYKVFVIGFGTAMPPYLKNTLNWMAYYGGTDNPRSPNTGSTTAYSIVTGCSAANTSACCSATNTAACYPTGVTSCATDSAAVTATCYDATKPYPGTTGNSIASFRASSNDPGYLDLSGYAFIAADADELVAAVKAAINIIREATYSFSQSSIQSNRTIDENFIYEGSFQPISGDSFWLGHLKKYNVNADGTVGSALWDAGSVLKETAAADRHIKTYKGGSLVNFTTTNITAADLAVATDAARDAVVGYVRGESAYNPDNWKLGDVFRSTPITVGTPSAFFNDSRDTTSPNAFSQYRENHVRASSPYSGRVIVAGANDGQLHAFKTSDGSEAWSFIPPNVLSRLKLIAHATEPTLLSHQYFVDGPVTVADAWLPSSAGDGALKYAADWRTLMVFAEGRGAGTNIWSSSSSCDSGFNPMYTSTYQYYCGYYAIDITDSLNPAFKWRIGLSSARAPYMGAPWSRMLVGRMKVGSNEKWVGFIGGGVYAPNATHSGKGFFVVDLVDGSVLWSYTKADNADLDYPMPAPPSIVDTDNDGFIDTAYIGDIGGNMWRFKFCRAADGDSCTASNWTGGRLFQANSSSGFRPIYTQAAVAKDGEENFWVYWGTGDKTDPTGATVREKIFAVKDIDRTSTRTISNLQDVSSAGAVYTGSSAYGFYIITGLGEKVLADVTVFGGVLYATTFTPSSSTNPCVQGGTATLYGIGSTSAAGALVVPGATTASRSMSIGTGIASAPVISLKPGGSAVSASAVSAAAAAAAATAGLSASAAAAVGAAAYSAVVGTPDLYVTTSGGGLIGAQTQRVNINPPGLASRTNRLFWKDRRIQ